MLTNQEKMFLKSFNFDEVEVYNMSIDFYHKGMMYSLSRIKINLKFKGLEIRKKYTREELGL